MATNTGKVRRLVVGIGLASLLLAAVPVAAGPSTQSIGWWAGGVEVVVGWWSSLWASGEATAASAETPPSKPKPDGDSESLDDLEEPTHSDSGVPGSENEVWPNLDPDG